MNRMQYLFAKKNKNVLNIFCTAGYPQLNSTLEVMKALQNNGADIIEIGIPCNNPFADGPVIQHSNLTALQNGMTVQLLFEQLENMRQHIHIPVILMSYLEPLLEFGISEFFEAAERVGVDGAILPGLTITGYEKEYKGAMKKNNVEPVFLITPDTNEEMIRKIDEMSCSFIYAVSSANSATGNNNPIENQMGYFKKLQQLQLKNPILVGFGIKDKNTFSAAAKYTNGAIIGTAYIKALEHAININTTTKEFINTVMR